VNGYFRSKPSAQSPRMLFALRLEKDLADDPFSSIRRWCDVAQYLRPYNASRPNPVFVDDLWSGSPAAEKETEFRSNFYGFFIIRADADDGQPFLPQQSEIIAEVTGLHGAGRRIVCDRNKGQLFALKSASELSFVLVMPVNAGFVSFL